MIVSVFVLAAAPRAAADNIATFDITGTFGSPFFSFVPGSTITIDTTTGLELASNIQITNLSDTFPSLANLNNSTTNYAFLGTFFDQISFSNTPSFIGFNGGPVTTAELAVFIGAPDPHLDQFLSSNTVLTAVTTTPEPSSFLLLATGALALTRKVFRRKRSRS
jgi:hypothetical protein